ncbi:MAG: phosphate ABC transporter substrate-binding/OmpA family protein [Porticoccaceae bacterium]
MALDTAILMDAALADLFWKLRLRLEAEDGKSPDMHRLRRDAEYREQCLVRAESSGDPETRDLAAAIRKRLAESRASRDEAARPPKRRRNLLWLGSAAVVLVAAGAFFFTAMTPDAPSSQTASAATQARKAPAPSTPQPAQVLFRIHGSNTIGEELAPALVSDYLAARGAQNIVVTETGTALESRVEASLDERRVAVEIHAHGSSTAFAGLGAGAADVGMASRRIKAEEVETLAPALGNLASAEAEHVIALDGLAVIVNPGLAIREIDVATLGRVFSGDISNWQQLGGPDLPIRLFARDDKSGTWDSFESQVLKPQGVRLAQGAMRFESSQELSDTVTATAGAIGFIGLPYVRNAKLLAIAGDSHAMALFPTTFTVSTEDYALSRRLYLYLPPQSGNDEARKFIDHVHASRGQTVVGRTGFISQNINASKPPVVQGLPSEYMELTSNAERLSLNVRFALGSEEIDSKAQRDLFRLVNFLEANPGRRIVLLGFTDSVGDPQMNLRLSRSRAQLVSKELMKLGIFPHQVTGFGSLAPIASNDNEEGRQRNRRVEVWII